MSLAQNDEMIDTLAPDGSDQPFGEAILPRRRWCSRFVPQEQLTIGYLSRLLRLPSLAPDSVTAIINGKHPPQLSAKRLMRLALKLPTDWAEQRKLLGFPGT